MLRVPLISALLFATTLAAAAAGDAPALLGRVEDNTYISPTGAFAVPVPVLTKLGGTIKDTPNVVTFRDDFTTHISIAAFPQDATQRWQLSTLGPRDYLKYFFANYVLPDFTKAYPKVKVGVNARFLPAMYDGTFIVYILLPGGSMFANRVPEVATATPRVAKRGNLLFVKNGFIFLISSELAERITEGSTYHQTDEAEDNLLRTRLIAIANKIQFTKPPAPAAK